MEAKVNLLAHSTVDGRGVWLYEIISPIAPIYLVDYEKPTMEIVRVFFDSNKQKAERYYINMIKKIVDGKK